MLDVKIRNGDADGPRRRDWLRERIAWAYSGFKSFMRAWWPVVVTAIAVTTYLGALVTGHHSLTKVEKLGLLGVPAGAILCSPLVALLVKKLWNPQTYFYHQDRGDDSENPREIWELNEAAHRQMTSMRHQPERERGTLHPTFNVMEIDTGEWVCEPGYRGRMDAEALRRDRQNFQILWERCEKDGLRADMYRDYLAPIVRELDFQRAQRRNSVIEDHTHPGQDTVDDVIRDVVPGEYLPDEIKQGGEEAEEDMIDQALEGIDVEREEIEAAANGHAEGSSDGE